MNYSFIIYVLSWFGAIFIGLTIFGESISGIAVTVIIGIFATYALGKVK